MTIGIGCICERGECIVMASDMRATYGTSPIGPNDACGKVFRVGPFNLMACVAGGMSPCHAVISQLFVRARALNRKKRITREDVMLAIDESRGRELRRIYDWAMQAEWGITFNQFALGKVPGGKLDSLLVRAGYHLLERAAFKVELIVAGFVRSQTMFFRAAGKRPLEEESSPAVYAIGSGEIAAMTGRNSGRG